jgi:hypothetical protein
MRPCVRNKLQLKPFREEEEEAVKASQFGFKIYTSFSGMKPAATNV